MTFTIKLVATSAYNRPSDFKIDRFFIDNHYAFPDFSAAKLGDYHLISTSKCSLPFTHSIGKWLPPKSVDDPSVTYVEIDRKNSYKTPKFLGFGCTFTDLDLEIFQQMPSTLLDSIFNTYFSANGLNFKLLRVSIDKNFESKQRIYRKNSKNHFKIDAVIQSENFDNASSHLPKLAKSMDNNEIELVSLDINCSEPLENVIYQLNRVHRAIPALHRPTHSDIPKICLSDCTQCIGHPWLFQLKKSEENSFDKFDMISLTNHSVSPQLLCRSYRKCRKAIIFTKSEKSDLHSQPSIDQWQKADELIARLMLLLHQNIVGYFENSLIFNGRTQNPIDSLITINENHTMFSRHTTFYAMAHFSRHILPHSKRLAATICGPMALGVQTIAYLRSDDKIVILLYNPNEILAPVTVVDRISGQFQMVLQPKSINSIVYCI